MAVGKLAWHIYHMTESVWVRWVHEVYTKGANWLLFNHPPTESWALCKIYSERNKLSPWIQSSNYSLNQVYKEYSDQLPKVPWSSFVWNRVSVPKAQFVVWLVLQDKLMTKHILL